jgi:hypothetical protein
MYHICSVSQQRGMFYGQLYYNDDHICAHFEQYLHVWDFFVTGSIVAAPPLRASLVLLVTTDFAWIICIVAVGWSWSTKRNRSFEVPKMNAVRNFTSGGGHTKLLLHVSSPMLEKSI